jgi:surface carbohydrate biosynthesis protein (TIGR04326 family)
MSSAVIWFHARGGPLHEKTTVYWQQFVGRGEDPSTSFSLPQIVGDQTQHWKAEYLGWLAELGKSSVRGTSLERALMIRPDLSYWWMTLPTAPCFTESSVVYQAVRLWAFAALADELRLIHIQLVGASREVTEILSSWARQTGRTLTIGPDHSEVNHMSGRKLRRVRRRGVIHHVAKASVFLFRQYLGYRTTRSSRGPILSGQDGAATFIDYFDNFRVDEADSLRYISNYWGRLPASLFTGPQPPMWLHVDCRSSVAPSIPVARGLLRDLNGNSSGTQHSLLQDLMSSRLLISAVATFLRISLVTGRARPARSSWLHPESNMNMWPLVRDTWRSASLGIDAAQNALWIRLFEKEASSSATSRICVYLMENQPWELALISSWRRAGHGSIYGVAHSMVRQWDLRYSLGWSHGRMTQVEGLPQPDLVLANGPISVMALRENGLPIDTLCEVEAVRYLRSTGGDGKDDVKSRQPEPTLRVLALGEYDEDMALAQVRTVNAMLAQTELDIEVTFRAHPSAPPMKALLDPRVKVSTAASIASDLANCGVVVCGSVSSALVDAMLAGIPTLVLQDARVLDGGLSKNGDQVAVIHDGDDVIEPLLRLMSKALVPAPETDIFFLDPDLPRWRAFLAAHGITVN